MNDLIIAFKDTIIPFFDVIIILFGTPLVALGFVYACGRMLNILKTDRSKNILAIVVIYTIHYFYTYFPIVPRVFETQGERLFIIFIRGSVSIVIYVLLLWKLYWRFDAYLDKKFGEDTPQPIKKPSKNRRVKK